MMEPDDGVRLVLMDNPGCGFAEFWRAINDAEPDAEWTIAEAKQAFTKYRGWDGRVMPTHSIETGKRLF